MALQRKSSIQGTYGATVEKDEPAKDSAVASVDAAEVTGGETSSAAVEADSALATVTELPGSDPAARPDGEVDSAVVDRPESVETAQRPAPKTDSRRSAASSVTESSPRSPRRTSREPTRADAIQLREDRKMRATVEEAYTSAKRSPREWGSAPIRIAEDVKDRLAARRALDVGRFGVDFAETHYIEAALSAVPSDAADAISWVEKYLSTLGLKTPDSRGTTGRLRTRTADAFKTVSTALRLAGGYGLIGHLQTAAVVRMLDSLDRLDAMYEPNTVELDD
ncbi:hypothetical protein [Nocardia tengchongensis]|uniref:hypothetical protein n=1 Tax=Nocardia tengchongensis TaxID=2055889 RepID=UPI003693B276